MEIVQRLPLEISNDGQRVVVGLITDIVRRMCLLNPLGKDVTRNTPGIVATDELDIHLHPQWQRALRMEPVVLFAEAVALVRKEDRS
jgi:predicted ATP-binding protein involved in virulence